MEHRAYKPSRECALPGRGLGGVIVTVLSWKRAESCFLPLTRNLQGRDLVEFLGELTGFKYLACM